MHSRVWHGRWIVEDRLPLYVTLTEFGEYQSAVQADDAPHATYSMQTPCNMQHTPCNMQHTPCDMQHTPCNMQHTPCNMQHTPWRTHPRMCGGFGATCYNVQVRTRAHVSAVSQATTSYYPCDIIGRADAGGPPHQPGTFATSARDLRHISPGPSPPSARDLHHHLP